MFHNDTAYKFEQSRFFDSSIVTHEQMNDYSFFFLNKKI